MLSKEKYLEAVKRKIKDCMSFIVLGIESNDRDCVRSYYEQLNDLMIEFIGEEK